MSYRACNGEVFAGTADGTPSTSVGFINGYSYSEEAEEIDVSTMGNCQKSYLAGSVEGAITLDGFSRHLPGTDPAQDAGQALFVTGTQISLAIQPNGSGSGKPRMEWSNVTILGKETGAEVDGAVTWNINARSNVPVDDTAQV